MLRKNLFSLGLVASALCFLSKSDDAGGGGAPAKPKATLEEQLTSARSERDTANGLVASLTTERDTARSERDNLQTQFNVATAAATTANTERDTARGQVTGLTTERDTARNERDTARSNVSRLETLCGVKGVDHRAVPPALAENGDGGAGTHVFDQWSNATGAAKTTLWRANHAAIRAEGERRAAVGNRA